MPDFLDFKIYRFLEKWDLIYEPDEKEKDPEKIIDIIEKAMERALKEKREIRLKLHTLLIGPDLWRRYGIYFDSENNTIKAFYGPSVNTSQYPVPSEQPPPREAERKMKIKFEYNYKDIIVDIFSGPSLAFVPEGDKIKIIFLPWHREWTHGLFPPLILSVLLGAFLYILKSPFYLQDAMIFFIGFISHGLLDQLGHMGVNFLWPFQKERIRGVGIAEAMNPIANFVTIWFSGSLILFNIMRYTPYKGFNINPYAFFIISGILIPSVIILLSKLFKETKTRITEEIEEDLEEPFKNF